MIQKIYAIEKSLKDCPQEEKLERRRTESRPLLDEIKSILDRQKLIALPKSKLGKAVTYALNNWEALGTYTGDGALTIDNNQAERALRSMAVGRKNWLFMGSKKGGKTNTIIASFISTCKNLGLHPRLYLEDVLTRLAQGETDLESLLPDRWQPISA